MAMKQPSETKVKTSLIISKEVLQKLVKIADEDQQEICLEYLNKLEDSSKKMVISASEKIAKPDVFKKIAGLFEEILKAHYTDNQDLATEKAHAIAKIFQPKKSAGLPPPSAGKKTDPPVRPTEDPKLNKKDLAGSSAPTSPEEEKKDTKAEKVSDFTGEEVESIVKITCEKCKKDFDGSVKFCEFCGDTLNKPKRAEIMNQVQKIKRCPTCQHELDSANEEEMQKKFCGKCGVVFDVYIKAPEGLIDTILSYFHNGTIKLIQKVTGRL